MEKNIWHVGENNENLQNDLFEHWTTSAKTNWQCDSHHGTWQQMPCHLDEDTDVFVLALSFCSHINANLYFHTAKGRESQITDLSKLHSHLGQEKCDALVGLHPFSGCDSQATLFKSGRCSERDLPPNQDSLHIHIQRASNLAAVHRRSLECYPDIPPPINHGWKMAGELYEVDWMSLPPAPEAILELVHCSCKKKTVRGKRTCKVYELPCTNLCKCTNCDNNTLE